MSVNNRGRNSKRAKRAILLELEQAESFQDEFRRKRDSTPSVYDDMTLDEEQYSFISPEQEDALMEHLGALNVHVAFAWLPRKMLPRPIGQKIRFQ